MKCIQCGRDNKLKDRQSNGYRCQQCDHPFAFEPTSMGNPKFTDGFFSRAIADLSTNNTLYFTPKQLLYLLDRRLKRKQSMNVFSFLFLYLILGLLARGFLGAVLSPLLGKVAIPIVLVAYNLAWIVALFKGSSSPQNSRQIRWQRAHQLQILGALIAVLWGIFGVINNAPLTYGLAVFLGLPALWLGYLQKRQSQNSPEQFLISETNVEQWLERWVRANGGIPKLLPSPTQSLPASDQTLSPDPTITTYSFDRLVVCQSDAIAHLLIRNHFHFENNCAVLGLSGYPQPIFDVVMQMVRRNPDLKVFAFHDCSPAGVALIHQLRTDFRWFPDTNFMMIDVGLLPRQILAAKRGRVVQNSATSAQAATTLHPQVRENLLPDERQWLETGNFVELESFPPQQLIRILNRSLAMGQTADSVDNSLVIVSGSDPFYAVDSFG